MKKKTNIQALKGIMEYSQYGALAQIMVFQALDQFTKVLIADEEKVLKDMENGFVYGPSWVGVAKEIKSKLDEHFGVV